MQFDNSPENTQFPESHVLQRQAEIRAHVLRGCEQLKNGEYVELDEEGLDRFFEELFAISEAASKTK